MTDTELRIMTAVCAVSVDEVDIESPLLAAGFPGIGILWLMHRCHVPGAEVSEAVDAV